MKFEILKKTLLAASIVTAFGLAGCSADGSGTESGSIVSDGGAPLVPPLNNDGSTPTTVKEDNNNDGTAETVVSAGKGFICTKGARAYDDTPLTVVGANGLVGDPVSKLLITLGGFPVTTLTNSVTEKDNVIDGHLGTYATFTLPASGLGPLLDSVDESVLFHQSISAPYVVFGMTFPAGLLQLSLTQTVTVTTYLGSTKQETVAVNSADLNLLGQNLAGDVSAFIGIKARKSFDRATIGLSGSLLSANVGSAVHVHELCTDGSFVTPPTKP